MATFVPTVCAPPLNVDYPAFPFFGGSPMYLTPVSGYQHATIRLVRDQVQQSRVFGIPLCKGQPSVLNCAAVRHDDQGRRGWFVRAPNAPCGAALGSLGNARVALYFSELLIEANLVFSLAPRPFTTAMMASEIPAAINPYSIAVAAVSSAQNFRTNLIMRGRCRLTPEATVNIDR
jgi:hypothetical protein